MKLGNRATDRPKRNAGEQDPWEWVNNCLGAIMLVGIVIGLLLGGMITLVVWLCLIGLWYVAVAILAAIFVGLPLIGHFRRYMRRRRYDF